MIKPREDELKISQRRRYKYLRQGSCALSCAALQYTMKSLALILGLLAAVQVCNCNIQLCTAVMFGLAVEIMNICGSAQTDLRILIFINIIRWYENEIYKGVY
jgi:hypothetical protein